MMNYEMLVRNLNHELDLELSERLTEEDLHQFLSEYINRLITGNFQKLVALLYRIDVNEEKLKELLRKFPGTDAGALIATLIIERQVSKIKSRKENRKDDPADENEKW